MPLFGFLLLTDLQRHHPVDRSCFNETEKKFLSQAPPTEMGCRQKKTKAEAAEAVIVIAGQIK